MLENAILDLSERLLAEVKAKADRSVLEAIR